MNHRRTAWLLVLLATATGCGKSLTEAPKPAKVPDRADAIKWAKQFEAEMKNPGGSFEPLDWDRFFGFCSSGVEMKGRQREQAKRGFISGVNSRGGIAGQVRSIVRSGGEFVFLRVHKQGDEMRALFRLRGPDIGVNYHDYDLIVSDTGKVMAEDIYIFAAGERFSATMRRLFLQFTASRNRGLLARMTGKDKALVKNMEKIQQMTRMAKSGNARGALAIYNALPAELRKEKFVMLVRLMAATKDSNNNTYLNALTEYRKTFPGDPSLRLMSIDFHLLKKDHANALKTIDALDKHLGGDPFLDVMRATVHRSAGNESKAREAETRARKAGVKF